jgi:aminopeptidase-like protein
MNLGVLINSDTPGATRNLIFSFNICHAQLENERCSGFAMLPVQINPE